MNQHDSAQSCGCDKGAGWKCDTHRAEFQAHLMELVKEAETFPKVNPPPFVVKDSGERLTFSSGSMRDTTTGKIKWSRVTFGPMLRRWAQHLTTAEAKYPDPMPGIPNFTLIETDEEYQRYKESAFRHFMSWFYDEVDEDHASATFFNINGVEIIKDKNRQKGPK